MREESRMSELGDSVVQHARARLGQRVGRGECFDFADAVLRAAGAQSAADLGPVGDTADYVWGLQRVSAAAAQPGDIIQMRDVVITYDGEFEDGSPGTFTETYTHHTVIVIENLGGGRLRVLHQNYQNVRRVTEHILRLGDRTSGIVWVYAPS
jgi:hypothetical protein